MRLAKEARNEDVGSAEVKPTEDCLHEQGVE